MGAGACVEVETLLGGAETVDEANGINSWRIRLFRHQIVQISSFLEGCKTCVEHSIAQGPR